MRIIRAVKAGETGPPTQAAYEAAALGPLAAAKLPVVDTLDTLVQAILAECVVPLSGGGR